MTQLGDFIRAKREERKLSQIELARVSGISKATISQIEGGHHAHPKPGTLSSLAQSLRVPYEALDRLARGLSARPEQEDHPDQSLESVSHAILIQVQRLPIPQRDRDGLALIVEKYLERYQ